MDEGRTVPSHGPARKGSRGPVHITKTVRRGSKTDSDENLIDVAGEPPSFRNGALIFSMWIRPSGGVGDLGGPFLAPLKLRGLVPSQMQPPVVCYRPGSVAALSQCLSSTWLAGWGHGGLWGLSLE
jgi:hypothetical protein